MSKVQFHFSLSFAWWSSKQDERVDLCRAALSCRLCSGHLGDPQEFTVLSHPSILLSEIMILTPQHTEIYWLFVGLLFLFVLLLRSRPWRTKYKARRMSQRNTSSSSPLSCSKSLNKCHQGFLRREVAEGFFLCKQKLDAPAQKVCDGVMNWWLGGITTLLQLFQVALLLCNGIT